MAPRSQRPWNVAVALQRHQAYGVQTRLTRLTAYGDLRHLHREGEPGPAAEELEVEVTRTVLRAENLGALDIELTDGDRDALASLDRGKRQVDPPWAPDWAR